MKIISSIKKKFLGIEPPEETSEIKDLRGAWQLKEIFWWPVETESQAKQAVFVCLIFTCFNVFTWTISVINRFIFDSPKGYFNIITTLLTTLSFPAIMLLIAWGLFKIKRIAAIAGVGVFSFLFVSSIYHMTGSQFAKWETPNLFRVIFFLYIYTQAIRGASSYDRLVPVTRPLTPTDKIRL